MLNRMARSPYYHLKVVIRVARGCGGYENLYAISSRGWKKIEYLRTKELLNSSSAPAAATTRVMCDYNVDLWSQGVASSYLQHGVGKPTDCLSNVYLRSKKSGISSRTDELGALLCSFDQGFAGCELVSKLFLSNDEAMRTNLEVKRLQELGLIPQNINLDNFIIIASRNGSSKEIILISLLLRRIIELQKQLAELKNSPEGLEKQFESLQDEITEISMERERAARDTQRSAQIRFYGELITMLFGLLNAIHFMEDLSEFTKTIFENYPITTNPSIMKEYVKSKIYLHSELYGYVIEHPVMNRINNILSLVGKNLDNLNY